MKKLITFLLTASIYANAQKSFFFQTHYFQSEDQTFINSTIANGTQSLVCDNLDNWKVTLLSRTPDCPSNDQCSNPFDFRINLNKYNGDANMSITQVKALCNNDNPDLALPVQEETVAVVKFFNDTLCERNTWISVYAIRTGNECLRNFLNDSVAEGTKDGYIRVTCPSTGTGNGRISFFRDNNCKERIPSDIYTGPGYIDLNDRCFKGTNYIRAYCQGAAQVNEESPSEKLARECKEKPDQDKCKPPKDDVIGNGNGAYIIQVPNLIVLVFISMIFTLIF